ncbi:MAG: hypothetical protein WCB62_26635, partial [Pseudolabrys sp.]
LKPIIEIEDYREGRSPFHFAHYLSTHADLRSVFKPRRKFVSHVARSISSFVVNGGSGAFERLVHFTSQNVVVHGNDVWPSAWCGVYQLTHQNDVRLGAGRGRYTSTEGRDRCVLPVYLFYDTFFA